MEMTGLDIAEVLALIEKVWGVTYVKYNAAANQIRVLTKAGSIVGNINLDKDGYLESAWIKASAMPATKADVLNKALTEGRFSHIQVDEKTNG